MPFQSQVRRDQTTGIVGESIFDGPRRAKSYILDSTAAANNVFGRAFTFTDADDGEVGAGGTGTFAGIMANPKQNTTSGTAAGGTLAPTLTLRNGESADFSTMDEMIVEFTTAFTVGQVVSFVNATGVLKTYDAGTVIPIATETQILGAEVIYQSGNANTIGIIRLTNATSVSPTS